LFAATVLLWLPATAAAEDTPVTLGISPAISDIQINRGQTLHREITLDNKAAEPVAVRVYAENFEASDPYGAVSFNTDSTKQYSASSWLKLGNQNLVLNPRERQTLTFSISTPADAEPGGHYAAIFFEPVAAASSTNTSSIGISQRVGALLFITVGGNNTEQGSVLGAQTSGTCSGLQCSFKTDTLREWGPVPFTFSFQNTGNVHVKVSGKITITDIFGRKIGEVPIDEKTVLPGSSRAFEATWLREVLLGKYTAKLTLTYGSQRRTETAAISFWVIPWRAILGGALAIGATVLVIYLIRRRKNHPRKDA
jgi:hypothetical protein